MPLYPHTTFSTIITNPDGSTSGVPIPDPQFTAAEKDVILAAIDGTNIVENPVEGSINTAYALLNSVRLQILELSGVGQPLADLNTSTLNTNLQTLANRFLSSGDFKRHTSRISGASGGVFYDQRDGDFYGFTALQGVASAFNSAKDALRGDDDPVEDNYSIHFTSILGSGQNLLTDIIRYLGGDGLSIRGLDLGFNDTDELELLTQDLIDAVNTDILEFNSSVTSLINRDNRAFEDSMTFLEKYARGNIILGMNKDQYFGGRILDVIANDNLKSLLDGVSTV